MRRQQPCLTVPSLNGVDDASNNPYHTSAKPKRLDEHAPRALPENDKIKGRLARTPRDTHRNSNAGTQPKHTQPIGPNGKPGTPTEDSMVPVVHPHQEITKSLLVLLRLSSKALLRLLLKHQLTSANATTDGTPIATPSPMANDFLTFDPPPFFLSGDDEDEGFAGSDAFVMEKNGDLASNGQPLPPVVSPAVDGCISSWYIPSGTKVNGKGTPFHTKEFPLISSVKFALKTVTLPSTPLCITCAVTQSGCHFSSTPSHLNSSVSPALTPSKPFVNPVVAALAPGNPPPSNASPSTATAAKKLPLPDKNDQKLDNRFQLVVEFVIVISAIEMVEIGTHGAAWCSRRPAPTDSALTGVSWPSRVGEVGGERLLRAYGQVPPEVSRRTRTRITRVLRASNLYTTTTARTGKGAATTLVAVEGHADRDRIRLLYGGEPLLVFTL